MADFRKPGVTKRQGDVSLSKYNSRFEFFLNCRTMPEFARDWRSLPDQARSIGLLILGFTLLRLLLAAVVPLLPQEAYYWTWSRYPDWSYFDHPPLASYSIALTTAVFGQTAFGIKSAAVLWSLGWNILWARLILDMFGDRRLAFWSLAALNLTIVYEVLGFGPTPDAPLLFAWVGTIWAVWRLSATGDGRWWFVAGAFMGLSWLGKYSGALLGPIVLLYLLTSPRQRFWLAKPQPYLAFLLAIMVFSPVLIWNSQHEWVSLAFQSSRRLGEMGGFKPQYFLMLAAQQLLIVTPYLFVLAIAALVRESRGWLARGIDDPTRLSADQRCASLAVVHRFQLPLHRQDQLAGAGLLAFDRSRHPLPPGAGRPGAAHGLGAGIVGCRAGDRRRCFADSEPADSRRPQQLERLQGGGNAG